MTTVIPILRCFDLTATGDFYVGWLGFTVDWRHGEDSRTPTYQQVSRDGVVLHLSQHHGDACPGSHVRIACPGLVEYHRTLLAKDYRFNRPGIEDMPWGTREVTVTDPSGNRLTFVLPEGGS